MTPLATLRAAGLTAGIQGEKLYVEPSSKLTDELRSFIRAHKPQIMAELSGVSYTRCLDCAHYSAPPPDTAFWCSLVKGHPTVALWAICTGYIAKPGTPPGPTAPPEGAP
jgi:hypothetical protein